MTHHAHPALRALPQPPFRAPAAPRPRPRMRHAPIGLLAALALAGCQAAPRTPAYTTATPATTSLDADRDDVFGAVFVTAVRHEMAITDTAYPDPDTRVYLLVTAADEPVTLTLTGPGAGLPGSRQTGPLEITATIGRFGNDDREHAFVRDLARRLEQIRGEVAAPLPW